MTRTGLLLCLACLAPALSAATLEQALTLDKQNNRASAAVQQRIDRLDDNQREMLEEYLQLERRIELLRTDNRQLQARIEAQARQVESLKEQLQEVETTRLGLLPLMQQMQQVLTEFVDGDLPFLPQERQSRIDRLAAQMEQPDNSDGERYRHLLEAYLTELEYGRTIESYQGVLSEQGSEVGATRTVSFFRLGRTGLFYLTLDVVFAVVFLVFGFGLTVVASLIAGLSLGTSATVAAVLFFGGYAAQFIGHAIEKSMPVLVKHPVQANLAAPFFTVVEMFKLLGLRDDLFNEVQRQIALRRQSVSEPG